MPKLDSLERVFEADLRDIYDAEKRLTKALPKMIKAAKSDELTEALQSHLEVTNGQVSRLEQVFQAAGLRAASKPCAGMKGLLEEGQEAMDTEGVEPFTDLAIICAARRVEHYEMAAYLSLIDLAEEIHDASVTDLLRESLSEEEEADQTLASISKTLMGQVGDISEGEDEDEEEEQQVKMSRSATAGNRQRG